LVELEFPKAAVVLDPFIRRAHRRRDERGAADAAVAPYTRESRALEYAHVLRDGGERHVEVLGQFADRAVSGRELREHFAARAV
jgi:hypothetical protein